MGRREKENFRGHLAPWNHLQWRFRCSLMIGNIDVSLSVEVEKGGSEAFTPKITQDSTKQTDKISSFFAKRPSRPESGEAELTKRVKVVPPEAVPAVLPLRAPSPVALSPEEVKAIEARKLEALQRMEAKRLARVCRLEFEQLPADWLEAVEPELSKPYFVRLKEFLQGEWDRSVKIFPPADLIYTWAKCCPLEKVFKSLFLISLTFIIPVL